MNEETFEKFKAYLQKKYPERKIKKKIKMEGDKHVIKLFGYAKRMDGRIGTALIGKYYIR